MKKFLTVLLALSVVFTYTVGTAFAVVDTDIVSNVKAGLTYTGGYLTGTTTGTDKDMTGIEGVVAQSVVDNRITQLQSGTAADANAFADLLFEYDTTGSANTFAALLADQYAIDKAAADTALATDLSGYSAADQTTIRGVFSALTSGNYTGTYAAELANLYGNYEAAVAGFTGASAADVADKAKAIKTFRAIASIITKELKNYTTEADKAANLVKAKQASIEAIADKATKFQADEQTSLETQIAATSNALTKAELQTKLNSLAANVDRVKSHYANLINAVTLEDTNPTNLITGYETAAKAALNDSIAFYAALDNLADKASLTKYAETYAAYMKTLTDSKGALIYNASTIDAMLEIVKANIQSGATTSEAEVVTDFTATTTAEQDKANMAPLKTASIKLITENNPNLSIATLSISTQNALNALKGTYAPTNWNLDADVLTAIEAIQKDYSAKINVATDEAAVIALVKEAQAAMDAYLNNTKAGNVQAQVLRNMRTLGYATAANGTGGTIASYANSKNVSGQYSSASMSGAIQQAADVLYKAVLDQNSSTLTDAQVQSLLQNNYAAALAKIDTMPTATELTTAANAVIAAINALPTTVTIADKAQYLDAESKYEAYLEMAGANAVNIVNRTTLDTYMTRLIYLEKTAIEAQIRLLSTAITVDSKDAVEAARAAVDAYDAAYGKYVSGDYDYGYTPVGNLSILTSAEAALSNAQVTDAVKKISDLPSAIAFDDKAAVEAARTAYDSLTDAQKTLVGDTLYNKLTAAETAVKDATIKETKAFKIKAWSKLYKGKKIQVKWRIAEGDTSAITGYQVWKSTKANSGYKFMGKTKKMYMDNKKGLKKGKRYFYKVRAYVDIDGDRYFSDWSNKANRIYKK